MLMQDGGRASRRFLFCGLRTMAFVVFSYSEERGEEFPGTEPITAGLFV